MTAMAPIITVETKNSGDRVGTTCHRNKRILVTRPAQIALVRG